jgi:hypothetical protein
MKNLKLFLTSAFFITAIISLSSCEEKNSNEFETQKKLNQSIENNIGFYHNLALEKNLDKINKDLSIREIRTLIVNSLIEENDELFNEKSIPSLIIPKDILEATNLRGKGSKYDFSSLFNYLEEENYISHKLTNRLNVINKDIMDDILSESDILEKVNNLSVDDFSKSDKLYINAYVQVFNASHKFWTEQLNENSKNCSQNCNVTIIAADAAGGLYGMILGPISSVIQGAIFSTVAAVGPACDCD